MNSFESPLSIDQIALSAWLIRALLFLVYLASGIALWRATGLVVEWIFERERGSDNRTNLDALRALDLILGTFVVFGALLVFLTMGLGIARVLNSPVGRLGAVFVVAIASIWTIRTRKGAAHDAGSCWRPLFGEWRLRDRESTRWMEVATLLVALSGIALFLSKWGTPPNSWDALTYHLNNAIHWVNSGGLETLHQSTGDTSNTYYPIAAECFYAIGFLGIGSDWWVPYAQIVPSAVAAMAVAGLARALGASRSASGLAGLLWISTPVLLRQAVEAENDLWLSAWLFASTHFAMSFARSERRSHLVLTLLAAGLAAGTKFIGVVYCFVPASLVLLAFAGSRRLRTLGYLKWSTVGIALAVLVGGFSYIRNAFTSGNPLAPMRIALLGREILPGFVESTVFFGSPERNVPLGEFMISLRTFTDAGVSVFLASAGVVLAGLVAVSKQSDRHSRLLAFGAMLAAVMFAFLIPHRQHRLAAYAFGLTIPFAARGLPAGYALVGIAINLLGACVYLAKDFLLTPCVHKWTPWTAVAVGGIAGTAIIALAIRRRAIRGMRASVLCATGGTLGILTMFALQGEYEARRYAEWERKWGNQLSRAQGFRLQADRRDWARCWARVGERTRDNGAVVAIAGTNLPYPLRGKTLENEVLFIPRTADCEDSYFDWGHDLFDPSSDLDRVSWKARLNAHNVDYLCVFRDEDAQWTPELAWASEEAGSFERLWESDHAVLFGVRRRHSRALGR